MRLGCLLPLISIGLLAGGGQGVYTAINNPKPLEIGIAELAQKKPTAKWLKIPDGVLDSSNAKPARAFGEGAVYVPLVGITQDSSAVPIHVLVMTRDPALVGFIQEWRKFAKENEKTPEAERAFLLRNLERLRVRRQVEGVVLYGIEDGGKERRNRLDLFKNLAQDAIVLREGEKPWIGTGIIMFLGGLVLGVYVLASSSRKRSGG